MTTINLHPSWRSHVGPELETDRMKNLFSFLASERASGKNIYPDAEDYFAALNMTPLDTVRAVIIGQDPYHGAGQAHGMSFSVQPGVRIPPSLRNIYAELKDDLGILPPAHGYLMDWAKAGVLLLNTSLSVEEKKPGSHADKGWSEFTDAVIRITSAQRNHAVFILWGAHARSKAPLVDTSRHLIIQSAHPSPYSANNGFLKSKPFSRANVWLQSKGLKPIDWTIS